MLDLCSAHDNQLKIKLCINFMNSLSLLPLCCELIGFGNAGRNFHTPVMAAVPRLELTATVSSQPTAVQAAWPGVPELATPAQAFADPSI